MWWHRPAVFPQGFRYSVDAMDRAARAGHVDVLEFLWRQNYSCTTVSLVQTTTKNKECVPLV